jgi:DNA-binding response OmpR family regulator
VTERSLVADDDRLTARFLHSLLSEKGYEVAVADDGAQALELVSTHHPDLILSDMVMPYLDGMDLMRALRGDVRHARIPIILLSLKDREEDIVAGLEGGADDYVVKPFNARELLLRERKLLSRGSPARWRRSC